MNQSLFVLFRFFGGTLNYRKVQYLEILYWSAYCRETWRQTSVIDIPLYDEGQRVLLQ